MLISNHRSISPVSLTSGYWSDTADYDSDSDNNQITFSLDDDSIFSLTSTKQTSDWPATYSTQLMLTQSLDGSQQDEFRLTVTATVSHCICVCVTRKAIKCDAVFFLETILAEI